MNQQFIPSKISCLPSPNIILEAPIGQSEQAFTEYTAELLDYGVSWSIPNWNINRMTSNGNGMNYYTFTYGFAGIPDIEESKQSITACVLTCNNESTVELCLSSLRSCVDELIVLDSGSSDSTYDIAKKYSSKWYTSKWPGNYSLQRNISLELIDTEWAFIIDSDEFLDRRASSSIRKLISASDALEVDIIWFGRRWLSQIISLGQNIFSAKSYSGNYCFWPDTQPRLFRMNTSPFYEGIIHNLLRCDLARNALLVIDESVFINHMQRCPVRKLRTGIRRGDGVQRG